MSADIAHELNRERYEDDAGGAHVALQARVVLALGPATAVGGRRSGRSPSRGG